MAVTAARLSASPSKRIHVLGDLWLVFLNLTFSGSYSTGGDSIDFSTYAKEAGGRGSNAVVLNSGIRGYTAEYDNTNKKLKLFSSVNTELAAGAYNAALTGSVFEVAVLLAP